MLFVGAVAASVALLDTLLIVSGAAMGEQLLLVLAMMWAPAVVAVGLRLV